MAVKAEIQLVTTGASQTNAQLGQVAASLTRLGAVGNAVSGMLGGILGTGLLGTAGIAAAVTGLRSVTKGMEDIYAASQKVALSAEALSGLKYAAEQSGVGFDQLTSGLVKFSKAINEARTGNKELKAVLDSIGVSATDNLEQALDKVARQFKSMPESIEKTAIATQLFGRSGADLIEFLNNGADGLAKMRGEAEEFGVVISTEAAKAADEFGDNLDKLGAAAKGAAIQLVNDLVPGLASVSAALIEAVKNGRGFVGILNEIGKQIGSGLFEQLNGIEATASSMAKLGKEIRNIEADIAKTKSEDWFFGDLQQTRIQNQTANLEKKRKELADLGVSWKRLIQVQEDGEKASAAAAEAEARHGEMVALNTRKIVQQTEETKKSGGAKSAAKKATDDLAKAEAKLATEIQNAMQAEAVRYVKLTQSAAVAKDFELALKGWDKASRDAYVATMTMNDGLEASQKALKDSEKEVDVYSKVVERAAENMTDAFADFFVSILEDGTKAFKDFASKVKSLFYNLLSDMLSAAMANPIRIALGIGATGASGAASAGGGSLFGSMGSSVLGQVGSSVLGGVMNLGGSMSMGLAGIGQGLGISQALGLSTGASGMAPLLGGLSMMGPALGIGAIIAGLSYALKDRNPDEEWFSLISGQGTGKNAGSLASTTTAFGKVGVSSWEDLAGDGGEFAQKVTESVAALDAQIAQYLTQTQIDAAKAAIEGRASWSGAYGGDASLSADQATAQALKDRYVTLFSAIDQTIADEIAAAADSTEAVGQAIADAAAKLAAERLRIAHEQAVADLKTALGNLGGSIRGVTGTTATAYNAPTTEAQLASSAQAIYTMLGSLDASVESHQQLLGLVQDRYNLEVQYLTQIKAISAEVSALLGGTAESIRTTFFTPQETYDYQRDRANAAVEQLAVASTPAQVQALVATINAATQQAWQTLGQDTEEAKAKQDEFLAFLTDTEALAQERLGAMEKNMQAESQNLRESVNWNLDNVARAVEGLSRATVTMERAAQQLTAAAQAMPSSINVSMAAGYA